MNICKFFTTNNTKLPEVKSAYEGWKVCFRKIEHNYYGMGVTQKSEEWRKELYSGQCVHLEGGTCIYETSAGWINKTDLKFPEVCRS